MLSKCEKCGLSLLNCICNDIPKLNSQIEFCLLTHERELKRPTNTGRLIKMVMPDNTTIYEWKRKELPVELIKKIESEEYEAILVFPMESKGNKINTKSTRDSKKKILFILIDGTWQEARKIVKKSPYLLELGIFEFNPIVKSKFVLRRNIDDSHLCTVETAIELLKKVKEMENADILDKYFDRFINSYLADKSGHISKVLRQ